MENFARISLIVLLALALAPQLSALRVSKPEHISLFGRPTVSITIDAAGDAAMEDLLGHVFDAVELNGDLPELLVGKLTRRMVLGESTELIQLKLRCLDGITTNLLFTVSHLYLVGFANNNNHWFKMRVPNKYMDIDMPGATELPFTVEYSDLLRELSGEGINFAMKLAKIDLGQVPFWNAARRLGLNDGPSLETRLPIATFVIMVSESLRFVPIRLKVIEIWSRGTVGHLDEERFGDYIHNWHKLSRFVLCSVHGGALGQVRGASSHWYPN
ncbi:hypothetical protein BS78_06G276200 [Paspalum vaginatum]|nr:hypothetical protein BS78_06G276200 [Paspalum vaginatum]